MTDVLAGDPHPAHPTVYGSPFPPIADYGFLSDREVCAKTSAAAQAVSTPPGLTCTRKPLPDRTERVGSGNDHH